jgi:hypothetical protein
MSKYWNNQGRYNQEFNALYEQLVPMSGACATQAGELIRAVNRIYYDAFNNGFVNNTSGAVNFLQQYATAYCKTSEFTAALYLLAGKSNTGGYSSVCAATEAALDLCVDTVYEIIRDNPELLNQPAECDMFALQDKTYYEPEEDLEEEYGYEYDEEE